MLEEQAVGEHEQLRERTKRWGHEFWEMFKIIILSVVIVLPIRYFIVQPFIVRGPSMEPNFHNREYLVIDELSYYLREPERGEVIVFRFPQDQRQYFIKRIIGLPGERVEIGNGRITIADTASADRVLEEPYLPPARRSTFPDSMRTLGRDEYFVLGDNRDESSDSRAWGVLPRNLVVGRVLFRVWPPARFGFIPQYARAF